MKKTAISLILFISVMLIFSACGSQSPQGDRATQDIEIIITKDFGREKLVSEKVAYKENMTVMEALTSVTEVGTSYGGSYVKSIKGIEMDNGGISGLRKDWFYYLNGIFADMGALDYTLQGGDMIWWDYHSWEMSQGIKAVIGCYPFPFVRGYEGKKENVLILCTEDYKEQATQLKEVLVACDISKVEIKEPSEELLKNRESPVFVLGVWEQLKESPYLQEVNNNYKKTGTCAHFSSDSLELQNERGEIARVIKESAGIIAAVGDWSGGAPVWLIVGTDSMGFDTALNILINEPEKIKGMFSAAILQEQVVSLPLVGE